MSHVRAIVNPRSAHGRTARRWQQLARRLEASLTEVEIVFTEGPFHAAALARAGLESGAETIIAVGGDGTISETINGFFVAGRPVNPAARLGVIMQGTGGDFRRSHGIPLDPGAQVDLIASGTTRRIDIGRVDHLDFEGRPASRMFGNIASLGMSGQVCSAVNRARLSKLLGGKFAFNLASMTTSARYRNQRVELVVDHADPAQWVANTVAICNGRYFGGGMHVAPQALPDDGQFDIVVLGDLRLVELARSMNRIYQGSHLDHPKVTHLRGRTVQARAVDPGDVVLLEVDGEAPGQLPATFEILPGALQLIAPEPAGVE